MDEAPYAVAAKRSLTYVKMADTLSEGNDHRQSSWSQPSESASVCAQVSVRQRTDQNHNGASKSNPPSATGHAMKEVWKQRPTTTPKGRIGHLRSAQFTA